MHAQLELERYLVQHQGQATYLVATISASTAAPFILDTGKAVIALGGFNGFDAILSAQQVAALVAQGRVRFFLLPSFTPELLRTVPGEYRTAFEAVLLLQQVNQNPVLLPIQAAIVQWVNAHCRVIPRSVAEPGLAGPATTVDLGETATFPTQLFDCGSARSTAANAPVCASWAPMSPMRKTYAHHQANQSCDNTDCVLFSALWSVRQFLLVVQTMQEVRAVSAACSICSALHLC